MWLAQVICRLVYSVYHDHGNYYHNGSASASAATATATAATAAAAAATAAVAATEMVMTTTTNVNRLLMTEARVDQLDCGGTWTLDCRRTTAEAAAAVAEAAAAMASPTAAVAAADGGLACTDAASGAADAVVRLYLPANLSAHFDGQPAVSVGLPETARRRRRRGHAVTVVRCDGGGDGNQVTCSMTDGELWPPPGVDDNGTAVDVDGTAATDVNGTVAADVNGTAAMPAEADQRRYNWKYLFVIVFIASGGVGNILVCLAICLDRQLQNVTNYFLLSLAIADLLVCLFVMPLGAIPGFYGTYPSPIYLSPVQCSHSFSILFFVRKKTVIFNQTCSYLNLQRKKLSNNSFSKPYSRI